MLLPELSSELEQIYSRTEKKQLSYQQEAKQPKKLKVKLFWKEFQTHDQAVGQPAGTLVFLWGRDSKPQKSRAPTKYQIRGNSSLLIFINQTQHHRLTTLTNLQSGGYYGGGMQEESEMMLANHSVSFQTQKLRTVFSIACEKLFIFCLSSVPLSGEMIKM